MTAVAVAAREARAAIPGAVRVGSLQQQEFMNTRRLKPAVFVIANLLLCAAGCQLADFRGGSSTDRSNLSDNAGERLSDRQIADVQLSLARSLERQGETTRALDAYREAAQ